MPLTRNAEFKKNLRERIKRAGDRADLVVRITLRKMTASMIAKSPVGNPDIWKSSPPPGYVGGRFKNNWRIAMDALDRRIDATPDAGGSGSEERIAQGLAAWQAGQTILITNSLPYAYRIEHGWSGQAPAGVVGTTVVEFAAALRESIKEVR